MKTFIKKYKTFVIFGGVLLLALIFSACLPAIGVEGCADCPTEIATNSTEEVPTEEIIVPPPTATSIPPATGRIIFASNRDGQTDLYMTSPDGSEITRLTVNASVDEGSLPKVSPDGNKVAFSATIGNNMDIYILDIPSGVISRVTDAAERDASPSWSPNGQQLVFESFRDGNLEIYVVNVDGSSPTRLTNDPSGDSNPVWSPNSNEIVFSSNRFGNADLFLLSLNGAVATLTTNPAPDNTPSWSPDGRFLAFQSFSGEYSNICIIGRDGLNQTCITPFLADYGMPVWSWDGNWLAANSLINGVYGIQVFNLRDGSIVQLSQPGIEPRGVPAWSPDGLRVVFQAQSGGDMELYHAFILTNEFTRITSIPGYDGEPVWASR